MSERHADVPWRNLDADSWTVNPAPSMITRDEFLYLHWLARCRFTGQGEIVDGGPLLGGSTVALSTGLRLNPVVANTRKRIHSFDLFVYTTGMKRLFHGAEPKEGADLLPQFRRYTEGVREHVRVYPGDILQMSWTGQPIEILFIDVAKTWAIQLHLLREFFTHLIPGVSTVVQQDYFFYHCHWIHLVMEHLSPYFRVAHMPAGPTLGFELTHPIPPDLLRLDYRRIFGRDEAVALMDRSLHRFTGEPRLVATTAKIALLLEHDDIEAARQVASEIRRSPDFTARVDIDLAKAEKLIAARSAPSCATA
jgi:hypothetical protein